MLFGQETRPIADFLPRILAHIDGVDEEMVAILAMDAVIQFVRDSQILSEVVCVTLEPCIESYKLHTRLRPYEVLALRVLSHGYEIPLHESAVAVDRDFKTLYAQPNYCTGDNQVEVEFSVVPERDSEDVPAVIYEDWVEPVVAYTLARLHSQPDNQWYNVGEADRQMRLYQEFVRKARINRISRGRPLQMRLAGRRTM